MDNLLGALKACVSEEGVSSGVEVRGAIEDIGQVGGVGAGRGDEVRQF